MTNPGRFTDLDDSGPHNNGQPPQPKKRGCMKTALIGLAALVGIFVLVAILVTVVGGGDDDEGNGGDTATGAPADPEAELRQAIEDIVDDPTVEVRPNFVGVEYHIGNTRPLNAQDQTLSILSAVKDADLPDGLPTVEITGNAEFTSPLGETRDGMAFRAMYTPDILERMNPENMRVSNAWEVADNKFVHPTMQE